MSGPRLDTSAFRHYTPVRIGVHGPKGRLMKCQKKDGSGHYWKVRLISGQWEWPDDRMILDGPGDHVARCAECELPFMTTGAALLCGMCDEQLFGTKQRATETEPVYHRHDRGYRRR